LLEFFEGNARPIVCYLRLRQRGIFLSCDAIPESSDDLSLPKADAATESYALKGDTNLAL
jgi:hypothetical protein